MAPSVMGAFWSTNSTEDMQQSSKDSPIARWSVFVALKKSFEVAAVLA
mgnify:CR=1 FL=1